MSDMLNEKFEEFASEHAAVLSEAGDPMPTVTAAVLPGDAAASGQSNTAVNAKAAAGEGATGHAAPLQPGIAIGQKAPAEVNSVTTTPHEHDEDGDENPGAKAAAPISGGISGEPNRGASNTDLPNGTAPKFGSDIAYGTSEGGSVTYPIKPKFEDLDVSADVSALTEGTELSEEFAEKAKTIFEAAVKSKLTEEWGKLEEQFQAQLTEQVEAHKKELAEEVTGTINYAVTEGTELSEEFKEKATTIFEAAVKSKLSEEWKKLEEQFETRLSEQVATVKAELAEEVGGTIKYAIQAWLSLIHI